MSEKTDGATPSKVDYLEGNIDDVAILHMVGLLNVCMWPIGIIIQTVLWYNANKKDRLMDAHGRAVINFYLSLFIYTFVGFLLIIPTAGLFLFVFLPMMALFVIVMVVGAFCAMSAAKKREPYRYPLSIKFI